MKKPTKVICLLILIAALIGEAFIALRAYERRRVDIEMRKANEAAAEAEADEAARQAELERQQMKEARVEEEKSQWYLLLVNNYHAMPDDLEVVTADVGQGYVMDERVADAMNDMLEACRNAGYDPYIISTYRTHETQEYLYNTTANKADTAKPYHSEHECGLAADIIDAASVGWPDPLIEEQEDQPAQVWLMEHCHEYGFILRYPKGKEEITEIIYEPWHYRYVGPEHAANIMNSGLCLEEYLDRLDEYMN